MDENEEKGIVRYQAKDGQQIKLGFKIVRDYLVSGKAELVTDQEIMYFMGVCKSRGLNPFIKDCYLIKYDQSPAAIVTSIDYFRKRARAQSDCKGWKSGCLVLRGGEVVRTNGLVLETDELIGGWYEAQPDGWDFPMTLEVNLKGYIKKRRDGTITQFWQPENQPSQIQKVVESQGLRKTWPDEFQQLYTADELHVDSAERFLEGDKDDLSKRTVDDLNVRLKKEAETPGPDKIKTDPAIGFPKSQIETSATDPGPTTDTSVKTESEVRSEQTGPGEPPYTGASFYGKLQDRAGSFDEQFPKDGDKTEPKIYPDTLSPDWAEFRAKFINFHGSGMKKFFGVKENQKQIITAPRELYNEAKDKFERLTQLQWPVPSQDVARGAGPDQSKQGVDETGAVSDYRSLIPRSPEWKIYWDENPEQHEQMLEYAMTDEAKEKMIAAGYMSPDPDKTEPPKNNFGLPEVLTRIRPELLATDVGGQLKKCYEFHPEITTRILKTNQVPDGIKDVEFLIGKIDRLVDVENAGTGGIPGA